MPLPECLKQTEGPPTNAHDLECPICKEPFDINTLEHDLCGRRFDESCIAEWLDSHSESVTIPTCPICRAPLEGEGDQALRFRNYRRQRPVPERYTIRLTPNAVAEDLHQTNADTSVPKFETLLEEEYHQSDDMITTLGLERLTSGVDFFESADIVRRREEFHLSDGHLGCLWIWSRLLGANIWYLAQLDSVPGVGIFVPPPSTVHLSKVGARSSSDDSRLLFT